MPCDQPHWGRDCAAVAEWQRPWPGGWRPRPGDPMAVGGWPATSGYQNNFSWPSVPCVPARCADIYKVLNPLRLPCDMTVGHPKVVQTCGASECASHYTVVHFFPPPNFQKCSNVCVCVCVCTLSLRNVLRATTLHFFHITTSQSGSRTVCALCMSIWTCASPRDQVHFFRISTPKSAPTSLFFSTFDFDMCFAPQRRASFISHLARWLRTRRLREPTFPPSGAANHWKNDGKRSFAAFLPFRAPASSFFIRLSLVSPLIFTHLLFLSVRIVRSLTSKLTSAIR